MTLAIGEHEKREENRLLIIGFEAAGEMTACHIQWYRGWIHTCVITGSSHTLTYTDAAVCHLHRSCHRSRTI